MRVDRLSRAGDDLGWGPLGPAGALRTAPPFATEGRVRRPWDGVSWWYSLILAVPVLILLGQFVEGRIGLGAGETVAGAVLRVTDRSSGAPVAGAQVMVAGASMTTDSDGEARLEVSTVGTRTVSVSVSGAGYESAQATLDRDHGSLAVALRPTTLSGTVLDSETGQPLPNAQVRVVTDAGPTEIAVATGADGGYRMDGVPAAARVRVDAGDWGVFEEPIADRATVDIRLRRSIVTGTVSEPGGAPIPGAVVTAGTATAVTGDDGTYRLTQVPDDAEVEVVASGYADARGVIGPERTVNVALEAIAINAIYANQFSLGDPAEVDRLIGIIDETAANALVVDVKQDTIYYETRVPFFTDIEGMVAPVFDPGELLEELAEHDIYAIARMVVFNDPVVAEGRPDLAVTDDVTGGSWRDYNGQAWVNAFYEELWDANIALALEIAELGFDEVQYDYVRFPSDGDLTTANFGPDYSQEAREGAITGFIARSSEQIRPTGIKFAADLFAMIALQDNDQGIGQRLKQLAPLLDYVCLMVYPSHYTEGNIESAPGHPNDYPYETVLETLERGEDLVPGTRLKQRPWLQDFSYPVEGLSEYGEAELRAQIEATEDFGASGWMLWNPANEYHTGAFPTE
jgi:protocatechuate 3,4-dioxygenase beta subunit